MSTKNRSSDDVVGGARGITTTTKPMSSPITYPRPCDARAGASSDVASVMAKAARHALDTCPSLTPSQKQQLRDVEKGRYQFKILDHLLEIFPSAKNPFALLDALRGPILRRLPDPGGSLLDVTVDETLAQTALDPWQMRLLDEKTSTLVDATLDRVGPNLVKLERYRDFLLRYNPTSRRTFA